MPDDGGKRVLVFGCSPLPFENQRMNYAPGTRTWQLAQPLAAAGHAVCVVGSRIPGAYDDGLPEIVELERAGAVIYTLERDLFESDQVLPALVAAFKPEVLVGASALPSRRATELAGEVPVWVDLFGDPMAEAQAKAALDGRDDMLAYFYLMSSLLARGDAFAAVSERQGHAVIGQLGLAGRLNRATEGLELVHTVPCALWQGAGEETAGGGAPSSPPPDDPAPSDPAPSDPAPSDIGPDDFVVLWSGGFNTWGDVETLFAALELAIREVPKILFVSTGGKISGHDEDSYGRFVARVEGSELRHRFLLKGLLPADQAERYLARADLGVVTERDVYERYLGSSARMVHWLGRGLPFVCSEVSELGTTLGTEDLALTYAPGDVQGLARRITEAATDPEHRRRLAERGKVYAERHWTFERTTRPLRAWVERAARLPDAGEPNLRPFLEAHCEKLEARIEDLEDRLERRDQDYHEVRRELGDIHQSRAWDLWMTYLDWRQALLKPFKAFRR